MTPDEIIATLSRDHWNYHWDRPDRVHGREIHLAAFLHCGQPPLIAAAAGETRDAAFSNAYNLARELAMANGLPWTGRS